MKCCAPLQKSLIVLLAITLSAVGIPQALALAQETDTSSAVASSNATPADPAQSTATFEKSEVVYANLSASGMPQEAYVVNRFEVEQQGTIIDAGAYTEVVNLTNETDLTRQGDAVVFEASDGVFSYQGTAQSVQLPWNIALTYEMDGTRVVADELVGASGNLAIHIHTSQNTSANAAFFDSYMMQITFTLPTDACSHVTAEGATVATAGQDYTVAFTALPGHEGTFTLEARVHDFHMSGAQVAALPYAQVMDMPDTDGMVDDMTQLSSAVSALADGTAQLARGVDGLTSGARDLSSGAAAFGKGLTQLNNSSSQIVGASQQIKDALSAIDQGLASADLSKVEQLAQLPGVLNQLADGLEALQGNAQAVQQAYAQSLAALDGAVAALPASTVTEADAASLTALANTSTNPRDAETAAALIATYDAAQVLAATYQATKPGLDAASGLLSALAADASSQGALAVQAQALRAMASQMSSAAESLSQLPTLVDGLSDLSGHYATFHDGIADYTAGVSTLASNYCALEAGTAQLAGGTAQLASGAATLSQGAGQLNASTITLPDTMRAEIEAMMADYDFPEFTPVSFMSPQNTHTVAVQFVMATPAIEAVSPEVVEEEEAEPTLWDRFVDLFRP